MCHLVVCVMLNKLVLMFHLYKNVIKCGSNDN